MQGIKVLVGDIVELSPTKLSTLEDLDLERCTVLEVDEAENAVKVVFNNNNAEDERFFDHESTIDWFSIGRVIDIERDYKITRITDNQDTVTNQPVAIATMAKVVKSVTNTPKGYNFTQTVSEKDNDTFIFMGITYDKLKKYIGGINRITFSNFRVDTAVINGKSKTVYYATGKIRDIKDVFTVPKAPRVKV